MRVKFHLVEKRKHPRNEAERKYRLVTRSKRLTKRAAKLKPFTGKDGKIDYGFGHGVTLNKQFTIAHRERQRKGSKKGREERLQWLKARGGEENNYQTPNYVSKAHIRKQKAKLVANKEKRDFSQSMGSEENGFEKLRKEGLYEKRRHPRNEAEQVLRQQDRHQRGVRRAEQLRGLEVAGGTNAPKGHTRKAGNALQRLNQKQDSKAGKENTRVRHLKGHISMGIRDEGGQLTKKAAKTYIARRKAELQRKREKRQFDQSMGNKEDGFKKFRQGTLKEFLGMVTRKKSKVQRKQEVKDYNIKTGRRLSKLQTQRQGNEYQRNVARYQSSAAKAKQETGFNITGQVS